MNHSADQNRHRLLFVDDEEKTCKYFAKIFAADFDVSTATSAEEAWKMAAEIEDGLAVVISDQRMPGEVGTTLLGRFEQKFPDVIRILTTAYTDLSSAIEAVNVGRVYEYISKPWEIDDLKNKLQRAVEVYQLRKDRQRLVSEKLTVVERMVYLDRIRSLSLLATSLSGTVRGARTALTSYVDQAPLKDRIEFELQNATTMNLSELVRMESRNMLHAVHDVRQQLMAKQSATESEFNLADCLSEQFSKLAAEKKEDGMEIILEPTESPALIYGDPEMIDSLFRIIVNRLGDMREDDLVVKARLEQTDQSVVVVLEVNTPPWENGQISSLFSALMPVQRWPLGQDMDLLSAFFIAHHFGGDIRVDPGAPGFAITLAKDARLSQADCEESKWFNDLLDRLELWKQETEFAMEP